MLDETRDFLGSLLEQAVADQLSAPAFLTALAEQSVLVVLHQPPGTGSAAPHRNLMQWQHESGQAIVPLFTSVERFPGQLPHPFVLVRVLFRTLLSNAGAHNYQVNPLSPISWKLSLDDLSAVRRMIEGRGLSVDAPSLNAPWVFRAPRDDLYPVACALAAWFVSTGCVDIAYLYELGQGGEASWQTVLGVEEPPDRVMANTLVKVAASAGLMEPPLIVRFLPDEPSHRAGLNGLGLEPFYRRPR